MQVGWDWIGRDRNNMVTPAVELGGVDCQGIGGGCRARRETRIAFRGVIVFHLRSWRRKDFTRSLRSVTSSV